MAVFTDGKIDYTMKRLIDILFFALMLACVSCQQAELLVESEVGLKPSAPEFTAQVEAFGAGEHDGEGALTKTALAGGNSVVWSAQDQIAVFQGTSTADTYQVDEKCIGTREGRFGIVAKGESATTGTFDANIAIYPYQEGLTVTPTTATEYQIAGVTIPSVQTYTANTFSNGSFLIWTRTVSSVSVPRSAPATTWSVRSPPRARPS